MFRAKSSKGTLFQTLAKISRPVLSKDRTFARSFEWGRYKSTSKVSQRSPKGSPALKIAAGLTTVCGGSVVATIVAYHYSSEFRRLVDVNLPALEPLLGVLDSYLNSFGNTQMPSKQQENVQEFSSASGPLDLSIPVAEKDVPLKNSIKPVVGNKEPVASVSSLDQSAISAVDLAIATSVEKEAADSINQTENKPDTMDENARMKQSKGAGGNTRSPAAAVSVLDHVGVSSVDLDMTATVEKGLGSLEPSSRAETSTEASEPKGNELDTSLTEKEIEAMVDKTSMELLLKEALSNLKVVGQDAMEAQQKAAAAIRAHVEQMKAALSQSQQDGMLKDLSDVLLNSQKFASDCVAAAKTAQVLVNEEVEKLLSIIKEAEATGAKDAGTAAFAESAQVSYDVQKAALDMQQSEAEIAVLEVHQKDLQDSVEALKKELLRTIPGALAGETADSDDERKVRSESVLLAYARKRLEQLTRQLATFQVEEQKRLENSLKVQKEEDSKLTDLKVKQETERMAAEFQTKLRTKEADLAAEHEASLRQQLRRQAAAYSDHLAEVLRVQETELQDRHNKDLQQKLNEEKSAFETQLTGVLAHMRGIEAAVEGRAEIEKQNMQSQKLWAACQALTTAISNGDAGRPRPLLPHLTAIHEAAADDPLVTQVLNSLPEEAVTRGVLNEENVKHRFYQVRRWCRRVAMIGDDGASPWKHLLSYFQSFFIFDSFEPTKEGELVDFENTDTFDLLARADYYLRRGDLELATRLVNQLRGEPRKVARDWLIEARLLLETRQAANLLTAYATVLGSMSSGQ
ncbi:MICOS complex subunit Mic60 [Acropora cervicornis]|uniref:MICOS complex subunit MIC60 n=1 Tax=Acropora cervicornis TaxID=6130 RepID=A0AAD9R4J1_ACRCE|nr:MICOS complex subunit Mic60 [Acropora cervicornis]